MENRITEKTVTIDGRQFILTKFTPYFGVYLAVQTFGSITGKKNKLEALAQALLSRPKDEFIKLQQDVLQYCFERLPAGPVSVVNSEGNFAVVDMTAPLALNLFIQTLIFAMSDFFTEGAMENLQLAIKDSMEAVMKLPQKN